MKFSLRFLEITWENSSEKLLQGPVERIMKLSQMF